MKKSTQSPLRSKNPKATKRITKHATIKKVHLNPLHHLRPRTLLLSSAHHLLPVIQDSYTIFFNPDDLTPHSPWIDEARPLNSPIHEVTYATIRFGNGHAAGIDEQNYTNTAAKPCTRTLPPPSILFLWPIRLTSARTRQSYNHEQNKKI